MTGDDLSRIAGLLPESVAQLAGVIGWPGALALVDTYPGRTLDLPKAVGAPIWVALDALIGPNAAQRLWRAYAPGTLYIPACKALAKAEENRRIREEVKALEARMTTRRAVTQTAQKWRYTERTIWRALAPGNAATSAACALPTLYQLPLL